MNVNEAMAKWEQLREMYDMPEWPRTAMDVLIAEVERLRDSIKIYEAANVRLAMKFEAAKEELAAAKAASVVPVGITDLELCNSGQKIEFYIEGDKADGAKMLAWLRDRMKGGEG